MKTLYIVLSIVMFLFAVKSINTIEEDTTVTENTNFIFSHLIDKDKHEL